MGITNERVTPRHKERSRFNLVTLDKIEAFENRYSQILEEGFKEDYIINTEAYTKKKVKKSTSLNLLNRLNAYMNQILTFMYDLDIPFDNNLAFQEKNKIVSTILFQLNYEQNEYITN